MTEDVAVIKSWGPRAETAAECAERLRVSLSRIPTQRDVYSDWCVYPGGGADGPDDLLPASKDLDSLIELTEATVLRNDRGELMPGGGFSPLLTRLHRDRAADYRVRCGVVSRRLGNHGLLESPHPAHADPISQDENVMRGALLALVDT
ncbi:hypothetical protein CH254_04740 [Rhodococcus sp. 06-412-2C]|nr:hypothetical protein CH254_04740 [Rhodococcus sp. 06-412-2C]OZC92356.1 hypothetical protein CH279_26015 [Rhodococcus sp. 06-412-2B]